MRGLVAAAATPASTAAANTRTPINCIVAAPKLDSGLRQPGVLRPSTVAEAIKLHAVSLQTGVGDERRTHQHLRKSRDDRRRDLVRRGRLRPDLPGILADGIRPERTIPQQGFRALPRL